MMVSVLAYIDPNTGGALVALFLAVFGTLVFSVREVVSRLSVGSSLFKRKASESADVVVYSDDARYASTFMPVLERLDADGVAIDTVVSTWNKLMLPPNDIQALKNTAPRMDAADMLFYLRKLR